MRFTKYLREWFEGVGELTKKYSNLPESYIKRSMERVEWKTPRGLPQYLPRTIARRPKYMGLHRPWTQEYWQENATKKPKVFVEPLRDWPIFKGDRVEIMVGKDKGKQGTVVQVIQERNWVLVGGLNCKMKLMGKTKNYPGYVMLEEQPLLVTSEVRLVDPADFKETTFEWRFTDEGKKVRVSTRSGRIIPIPTQAEETYDYKTRATYKEASKDTKNDEVTKVTFSPTLSTFEMDLMKKYNIVEERIPNKTYWY